MSYEVVVGSQKLLLKILSIALAISTALMLYSFSGEHIALYRVGGKQIAVSKIPESVTVLRDTEVLQWVVPTLPQHLKHRDQSDPELIEHIRQHWIIPPYEYGQQVLDLGDKGRGGDFSEQGQPTIVDRLLEGRKGGFLVECGAADGRKNSNSLFFELYRNWTGVLIEANPTLFSSILEKRRYMFTVNACLSTTRQPMMVKFFSKGISGGILENIPPGQKSKFGMTEDKAIAVQCFPLYSILAALGRRHVDYFSLDIEGAEMEILRTIPFDDMEVEVFSVEKRVLGDEDGTKEKQREIVDFLEPLGYRMEEQLKLDIILSRLEN